VFVIFRYYFFIFKDFFFRFFVFVFFFLSKNSSFEKTLKHYRSFFLNLCKPSYGSFNYLLHLEKRFRLFPYKKIGQEHFFLVKIIDRIFGKGFFFYAGLDLTLYRLFHIFIIIYYHLKFFFSGSIKIS
jgi:hypothetical protein